MKSHAQAVHGPTLDGFKTTTFPTKQSYNNKICQWNNMTVSHIVSSTVKESSGALSGCENHPKTHEKHHREIVNSYICGALDVRSYCLHIWKMCFWVVTSGVQKRQVSQLLEQGSTCRQQKLKPFISCLLQTVTDLTINYKTNISLSIKQTSHL